MPGEEELKEENEGPDAAELPNAEDEPNENVDVVAGLLPNDGNVRAMVVKARRLRSSGVEFAVDFD